MSALTIANRAACRITFAVFCVAVLAAGPITTRSAAAEPAGLLADDPRNRTWHVSMSGDEAIYLGEGDGEATLVMARPAIRGNRTTLVLRSDAASVKLGSGETELTLKLPEGDAHELVLDAREPSPTLRLNDEELIEPQGKWIRLCLREEDEAITIALGKATYANVRFDRGAAVATAPEPALEKQGQSDGPGDAGTASEGGEASGESRARDSATVLEAAKSSVVRVTALDPTGSVLDQSTGFIVGPGLVLTSYRVVAGAHEATVTGSDGSAVRVELWDAAPDLDLALLTTREPGGAWGEASALPLSSERAREGETAWAYGYPSTGTPTVTKLTIRGVRRFDELPQALQQTLPLDRSSRWVETDTPATRALAGGPLLNARAEVVAINAWVWVEEVESGYALSVEHASDLLSRRRRAPLTFAGAQAQFGAVRRRETAMPKIEVLANRGVTDASRAARIFETSWVCPVCSGEGKITERKRVGTVGIAQYRRPVFKTEERECPRCHGPGMELDEPLFAFVLNIARELAYVDPRHEHYDECRRLIRGALSELPEDKFKHLRKVLHERARGLLTNPDTRPGEPVVTAGVLASKLPIQVDESGFQAVDLLSKGDVVLVTNMRIVDAAAGDEVIVGGLFAGATNDAKLGRVPVIQHGFIIARR